MNVKDTAVVSAAAILPLVPLHLLVDMKPVHNATVSLRVNLAPDSGSEARSNAVKNVFVSEF